MAAVSSGLPQVSLVYLGMEMIQPGKSFLYPDKQGTPEEGWRIQQPKCCVRTNNNKDEDNSLKNHVQNIAQTNQYCRTANGSYEVHINRFILLKCQFASFFFDMLTCLALFYAQG